MTRPQGRLNGKVAVVTGGTLGIGQGIVLRFLKEGASVAYCSRNPANNAENVALIAAIPGGPERAKFSVADAGRRDDMFALVAGAAALFGGVDIVINNAQGIAPGKPIEEKPDGDYSMSLITGFYQSLWASQAAFPHMRAKGSGRIILMSSHWSIYGHPYSSDYNSTKGANESLTRTMAHEWGRYGIAVNCVTPAANSVVFKEHRLRDAEGCERIARTIPMRHMGDCEREIAGAVLGLCSDNGRFITGQTICVDGGTWISPPLLHHTPGVDLHVGREQAPVALA
jgi:NAD(P)-dependent dehydrogenase (short-subunit alcohol dehydrogenase family)